MKEEILTLEEIDHILLEAKNPEYIDPSLMHLGRKKTSIFKVSKHSGLILVNGNDSTGRIHIDIRHRLESRLHEKQKDENPTMFDLQIVPVHYIDLADKIYSPENLCIEKNKKPELFDVYIGEVKFLRLDKYKYILVLYKNTKIIHTLYLSEKSKPFNKKKVLNWRQGWTSFTHDFAKGIETYKIPYFDHNDNERAKIILRCIKSIGKESWYVQINQEDGSPLFTSIIKEENCINSISPQFRSVQLDFSDMNWVEKEIKKLMNNEKHNTPATKLIWICKSSQC